MTPTARFSKDDRVQLRAYRDQLGVVVSDPSFLGGQYWYEVMMADGVRRRFPETNLEPFIGTPDIWTLLRNGAYADKKTFSKLVTFTKIRRPLRDNLYALSSARIRFYPYQYKPVLKLLESDTQRLLIADEVGLGKTIEAGLVMREMKARHELDRILVVCPSTLRLKWRFELRRRFEEEFELFDSRRLREYLRDFRDEAGEYSRLRAICSLQTIRSRSVLQELEATALPLDLVIVDEAHHMRNRETLSSRVGRVLSETADAMIMLTATPIHLGNQDLYNILGVLEPEEFDNYALFDERLRPAQHINRCLSLLGSAQTSIADCLETLRQVETCWDADRYTENPIYQDLQRRLSSREGIPTVRERVELQRDVVRLSPLAHVLTRTRKRDTGVYAKRTPQVRRPRFTPAEQDFYDAVLEYVIRRYEARPELGTFPAFVTMMPQRQVASSIQAMIRHYEERLTEEGGPIDLDETTDLEPDDFVDRDEDDETQDDLLALREVIQRGRAVGDTDSKLEMFLSDLRAMEEEEPGRKILVFAYFKATIRYLALKLQEAGLKTLVMTGDYPPIDERVNTIQRFREDPSLRVLLCTEVGSEGLDFEFCSVVVNYDLPWNPMVVEQRIGRLDRIGQEAERILIFNYSIPGTIEDRILTRLYQRIGIFERSIGDLEAILGDEIKQLTRDLLSSRLTPEEQELRIERSAQVIENLRAESEELESRSAQLIAHDQFFQEEMERIQNKKRFLAPEEIQVFFEEFLRTKFPRLVPQREAGRPAYSINAPSELFEFCRRYLPPDDRDYLRFRTRLGSARTLRFTYEAECALEEPGLELITMYHPLIRAVVRYYAAHLDQLNPVAGIRMDSEAWSSRLEDGLYLYLLCSVETTGARAGTDLQGAFFSAERGEMVGEEISEDLVYAMITDGRSYPDAPSLDPDDVDRARQALLEEIVQRIERLKAELERLNDALVNNRLRTIEQSFRARIQRREELLLRARARPDTQPRYIRMLEGGIRNLEEDWRRKREDLEKQRGLNIDFQEFAAGVLRIG